MGEPRDEDVSVPGGMWIERNRYRGGRDPHALMCDEGAIRSLDDADAEALAAPFRKLPEGVRWAGDLPAYVYRDVSGGTYQPGFMSRPPTGWRKVGPVSNKHQKIEPIPVTEPVPLHELIGRTLPGEDRPVTEFSVHARDGLDGWEIHTYCGHIVNVDAPADGTVEVIA